MTRTTFIKLVKILITAIIVVLIASFAVWRSSSYVKGPEITIKEPANGSLVLEKSTILKGQVLRAKQLLLNGNEINVDEQGNFSEVILVFPGLNLITLQAIDQFGRSSTDRLTLVGNNNTASTSLVR